MEDHIATKANRSADAARVARSQDEYTAQRHLAAIVEASGDAIISLTTDGVIETWNQSAERLYGYSAEEAVGKRALALLARDPAEREAMLARVAAGSEPAQTECQDIRKDGGLLDVSETNTPIRDPKGRVIGIARIARDVTERTAAEAVRARLVAIVEASGDAIIGLTADGVIETWNEGAVRLYGYRAEEAVGRRAPTMLAHDPAEREAMLASVVAGSGPVQADGQDIRKDGSLVDVSVTNAPIRDPKGRVIGIARIAQDVTARVEAEAAAALSSANARLASTNARLESSNALLRQAAELSRSNAELEQFASVASHDLQEPLRKVQTFAAQLTASEHDRLSEQGRDFLRRMSEAAARMRTLIDDLLMFSRVSTNGRPFVAVDLGEIVAKVLLHLELSIKESGARVTVDVLPTIEADPVQMRQLLQNLLGNALKFRREGVVPDVQVSVAVTDHVAELAVKDNGIGFDEQYATRIFGAFERLHGAREYAGTGIGLALCRKIVDRHHGTITAKSELGNGATFTVRLPIEQTSEAAAVTSLFPETIDQEVSHALA
jgi:PAS domain S-box-containing protein